MPQGLTRARHKAGVILLLALAAVSPAQAHHVVTEQVSRGPAGGNGAFAVGYAGATPDGEHLYLTTSEALVAADVNGQNDIYENGPDGMQVVSQAEPGASDDLPGTSQFFAAAQDGTRVVFATVRRLVAADVDDDTDIYARAGGHTVLLTGDVPGLTGPVLFWGATPDATRVVFLGGLPMTLKETGTGGTQTVATSANLAQGGVDADGDTVAFTSTAALLPADTDARTDVYRWHAGVLSLVSTGNGAFDATGKGISSDGEHIFFETAEQLVAQDTDSAVDVYEWAAGRLRVASTGSLAAGTGNGPYDAHFQRASVDGSRVVFTSDEHLSADDIETLFDPDDEFEGRDVFVRVDGLDTVLASGGRPNHLYSSEVVFAGASRDAAQVYVNSGEALTAEDEDFGFLDAWGNAGGVTRLLSTAAGHETDFNTSAFAGAAQDGDPAYFSVDNASFAPEDDDNGEDFYVRAGTVTSLATTGAVSGADDLNPTWRGVSDDGRLGWYTTWERATATDVDGPCPPGERDPCVDLFRTRLTGAPPSVAPGAAATTWTEGDAPTPIAPALTVTAPLGTILGATVTLEGGLRAGDALALAPPSGLAVDVTGPVVTISGEGTAAEYETALRAVTFASPGVAPVGGDRVFNFRVSDADHTSAAGARTVSVVAVDSPPALSGTQPVTWTEDDPAVVVAPALQVDDIDSPSLTSATAEVVGAQPGDTLEVDAGALTATQPAPGRLQLTGSATLATYQAVLRSVRFRAATQAPVAGTRTVRFVVRDGTSAADPADAAMQVVAVDDPPVLGVSASPVAHVAGGGPVAVAADASVTDVDSSTASAAVVSGLRAGDTLTVADPRGLQLAVGPTGTTLSGSAPLSTYRDVLRDLRFDTAEPGRRTLTLRVGDGVAVTREAQAFPAAPAVQGPPALTRSRAATFAIQGVSGATFACSLDGGTEQPCGPVAGLTDAAHTVAVRQTVEGLVSPPGVAAWLVDATPPGPPVITSGPRPRTAQTSARITWRTTEPGDSVSCRLDNGAPQPCVTAFAASRLGRGAHVLTVTQTDAAGNVSMEATHRWTVVDRAAAGPRLTVPRPTLVGGRLLARCALRAGWLRSCTVTARRAGRVVGRATRSVSARGRRALDVPVPIVPRGRRGRLSLRAELRAFGRATPLTASRSVAPAHK